MFSPKKKLAKQGLFWLTKIPKSLKTWFYCKGFTAGKTMSLARQGLQSCPHSFLQRNHLHATLWRLLGQYSPGLHIQALLENENQLFKMQPTHNEGNILISTKHTERIFVASKGNLKKTIHATVTKRKDFLSCKVNSSRIHTSQHEKWTSVDFLPLSHCRR